MTEDPYKALREWVDPQTGGTLPRDMRNDIIRLLAERERLATFDDDMGGTLGRAIYMLRMAEQRAEAAEARLREVEGRLEEQGKAWLHLWNQKKEVEAERDKAQSQRRNATRDRNHARVDVRMLQGTIQPIVAAGDALCRHAADWPDDVTTGLIARWAGAVGRWIADVRARVVKERDYSEPVGWRPRPAKKR